MARGIALAFLYIMTSVNKSEKRIKSFTLPSGVFLFCLFLIILGSFGFKQFQKNTNKKTASSEGCEEKIACPDCNIVLISVDSLRADHVGAYGYKKPTTPFFDQLASKGVLFENYFTSSFLTPISEMALHTGIHPSSSGMVGFYVQMPEKIITMAQFLKKEGYKTAALHTSPEFQSFRKENLNLGYEHYENLQPNFARGFDSYQNLDSRVIDSNEPAIFNELNSVKKSSGKGNKSFLWLTIGNVHWPYNAHKSNGFVDPNYKGIFKDKKIDWLVLRNIYNGFIYPEKTPLTKEDTDFIIANYDSNIRESDDFLKKFFDELSRKKLLDKTIVVIESEHGEDFGEHGYIAHYDIFDTQTHAPLLIVSPKIKSGKKVTSLSSSVDVLPTLSALIGRTAPSQVQGENVLGNVCNEGTDGSNADKDSVFIERIPLWEQVPPDLRPKIKEKGLDPTTVVEDIGIRTKKWKYILRNSKDYLQKVSWWSELMGSEIIIPEEELYDLTADPNELNNVASSHLEIVNDLKTKLLEEQAKMLNKSNIINNDKIFKIQDYF